MTIADPRAPCALDASVDAPGSAPAETISRKPRHYRGTLYDMFKPVLIALSTCGEYDVNMRRALKDLAKCRSQRYRVTPAAAEEAALIGRET